MPVEGEWPGKWRSGVCTLSGITDFMVNVFLQTKR
jgi:hypothetical protein